MREGIHPSDYRPVVFRDQGAEEMWITPSTVKTNKTITWEDGKEYPLYDLSVSMFSHPFFTGKQRVFTGEGRVQKFQKKYAKKGR